jgi:hypothetical protein
MIGYLSRSNNWMEIFQVQSRISLQKRLEIKLTFQKYLTIDQLLVYRQVSSNDISAIFKWAVTIFQLYSSEQ